MKARWKRIHLLHVSVLVIAATLGAKRAESNSRERSERDARHRNPRPLRKPGRQIGPGGCKRRNYRRRHARQSSSSSVAHEQRECVKREGTRERANETRGRTAVPRQTFQRLFLFTPGADVRLAHGLRESRRIAAIIHGE
ncbi:hypothetical protein PUN28_013757 [Cardiocondyla obscurior]|uniref:Secreted protein n=1 Tax=Cardiocondyla obscurior TaxID=286306 RepID=A0AAW2F464_9HYME